jgi:hypothetical protein
MGKAASLANIGTIADSSLGFRNRLINGGMTVDQRNAGASATIGPSTSTDFRVDRFFFQRFGGTATFTGSQSTTAPAGFTNSLSATVAIAAAPAAGDTTFIRQLIEGFNVADLGFGAAGASSVTVSFWVNSSITGTYGGSLSNGDFTRSYVFTYAINSANTWEYKTITVSGDTSGTWAKNSSAGMRLNLDLGSGSNLNGTANTWTSSSIMRTSGCVNWIANAGATFYITGVQLEKGSTATSFDYRPYGTELQLCQRYLPYFGGIIGTNQSFAQCFANTTTELRCLINFPVPARVTPTGIVASTASGFIAQMISSSNLTASAVSYISITGTTSGGVSVTVSGATANQSGLLYNASAGYIYFTGCEL